MDIKQIKQARPEWSTLSDSQVVDMVHQLDYQDLPKEQVARALGVALEAPKQPPMPGRGVAGWARDLGISALKGAIAVPEAAVGLADIATGGQAGKKLEKLGYRPAEARAILDDLQTDQAKQASAAVQNADGVMGTLGAVIDNPSVIPQAIVESAPLMGGGGGVARGLMKVAPRLGVLGAAAAGEGIVSAGSSAEQIRQQTADGLLTGEQAGIAATIGALTGGLGALGGKIAKKLGIGDVDTMIAQGSLDAGVRKGVVRSTLEGAVSEGILEELPQSVQEQALQNLALGKPIEEGIDQAAVLGALTGAAMGGGAAAIARPQVNNNGPLSRGANLALDQAHKEAQALRPVAPGLTPGQEDQAMSSILAQGDADMQAIKQAGIRDKGPSLYPDAPGAAPGGDPLSQTAAPFDSLGDRIMTTRQTLDDEGNREAIRSKFGQSALDEVLYYLNQADRPGQIPDQTRENMLAVAEEIISRSRLSPVEPTPSVGAGGFSPMARLGAGVDVPQIGLDTTPTGVMRADAQGNVAPETAADAIQTRQAQAEAKTRKQGGNGMEGQTPRDTMRGAGPGVMVGEGTLTTPERPTRQQPDAGPVPRLVYRPNGEPFKNQRAAVLEQRRVGGDVVPVEGGWAVQTQGEADDVRSGQTLTASERPGADGAPDAGRSMGSDGRSPVDGGVAVDERGGASAGGNGSGVGRAGAVPVGSTQRGIGEALNEQDQPASPQATAAPQATQEAADPRSTGQAGAGEQGGGVPRAGGRADAQADGVKKTPDFLKTKTVPEMTDEELKEAQAFYGPNHKRAKAIEKEMGKRAPQRPSKEAKDGDLPLTDIRLGDKVSVDGESYTVTGPMKDGRKTVGIVADRDSDADPLKGVKRVMLRGDDAVRAKIAAENRPAVAEPKPSAPAAKKAEMRPYRREDGSIGYEAVPIVESADQGQQDDLAAEPEMAAYERGQSAQTRADDRKKVAEATKPSTNTIFTEDAADKAREILRKKLGQMNSGLDPEMMQAGITLAGYHIEKGARTFSAYAKAMLEDLGHSVRPYLKSWYMGVKYDPRASGFAGMSTAAEVEGAEVGGLKAKQPIPAPADAKTLTQALAAAIQSGNMPKDNLALKKLVEAFDGRPADQSRMKQAQEELETAIVMTARTVVAKNEGDRSTFDALLRMYESQPSLNIRTSTSIANQAYSTPAPLAFLASRLAGITHSTVAHEPTGGTGMLLIGADPKKAIVNELNDLRITALKSQGFNPTQKDAATQLLVPAGTQPDAVVTNPPFGSVKDADGKTVKVKVDGFNIGQIDHLIAARALDTMKDDGRATLILGANKAAGGLSTDDRIFFNWLYSHYNVVGHFEVEGDLYARQGAGWPVRVITINGREKSRKFSPLAGVIQRVDNWEQVYEQFTQSLASAKAPRVAVTKQDADRAGGNPPAAAAAPTATGQQGSNGGTRGSGDVAGTSAGVVPDRPKPASDAVGTVPDEQRLNAQPHVPQPQPGQGNAEQKRPEKPTGNAPVKSGEAAKGNEFQTPYTPRSSRKDEGVLIPSNMAQPTQDALNRLEDAVGDIDEFARSELGYESVADLHNALMGLQVDSVATSIYQIKQGKAVVIADQTGIGKGRQAASIIRWAARQGMTPVFVSVKPSLFTDMYGDLADIGTNDVRPFIMNSGEWIAGEGGEKLFANKPGGHKRVIEQIADTAKLPDGSNAVFMTYSQINVANAQRQALASLAPNAVFILDESHNAAGASATGDFMIGALDAAKGVVYLSATYAKRPDNMPLYFKTDIGEAAADTEGLAVAMASGGLPLQTVVSNNLVKAGQMFRRERSYDGVSIESVFDTPNRALHERMSNEATKALRAIVAADRMFHEVYVKNLSDQLAELGSTVQDSAGNQLEAGVQHTEFSSVVHNFVKQMLLGLKAQSAADKAIESLKRGEKPIIAVENTMGSFLNEYAAANGIGQGDSLGTFDYRTVLTRALARSRVIIEVSPTGDKTKRPVPMSELDAMTQAAYEDAQSVIDGLTLNIPVSPIDWMRAEIQRAGFTVSEITGRNLSVDYGNPKKPVLSALSQAEQKDKVNTTRQFNSGKLDALILNVAGSTGISLHASEKFEDQRQRHMIVAQAAGDINIFMQMLGRVHRTGQVRLPKYSILSVDLPTEKRPTAVLSIKMKSLNANTSSNTESATSVKSSDILNKYGDQIVNQYLRDNNALARDLDLAADVGEDATEDIARKATGRLALQPIATQHAFYDEVEGQYAALIEYLNKTNQNDLEPRTFDFDAKETRQEVLFEGQNKSTPFGEDAIYGEYSIKAQGTPMKPEEIRAAMAENLGSLTAQDHTQKMLGELDAKFNAYFATLDDTGKDSASSIRSIGRAFLANHMIGSMFRVEINSEPFNAVILNVRNSHKETGNPYSMSKIQVSVAVNGALRSLSVPATQFNKIETSSVGSQYRIEQLFREQPPNQRETAKIITGNLLAAYGELKGVRGTIISFTKQDGTTEQGILLPKLFDFGKNTQGDYRLPDGAAALKFLQTSENKDIGRFGIMSRDGNVRVLPAAQGIRVQVPKSKLKGAKYFLDKGLIEVGGDFVSSGSFMAATVYDKAGAVKMLDLLMKKQALYALPSMASEAKAIVGDSDKPADAGFSRQDEGFRRQDAIAAIAHMDMVEDLVRQLTGGWKNAPEIVVLRSMDEAPEAVRRENDRQLANGATGEPEAFYHQGKAYLLASHMRSMNDVRRAVFHEVLGHLGMRGLYGTEIGEILDQVARARRADVEAKAKQYGLNMKNARDRQIAAEEWLAEIAQDNPQLGFVRRAVAAIRSWLRRNVPALAKMRMTDDEIVRELIAPVQRFIKDGPPDGGMGLIPAFRRDRGFSRSEGQRVSVKRDESGERVYSAGGVTLAFPIESERLEVIPSPGQKILNYAIMPTDSFDVLGNMEVLVENGEPVSILDINVDGRNKGVGAKAVGMLLAAHPATDMNVSNIIPAAQGFWEKMGIPTQNREEGAAYDGTINHATYLDAQAGRGAQGVLAEDQGQDRQADGRAESGTPQALGGEEVGFSRTQAAQEFTGKAREAVQDFFGSAGAQVDFLDRTFKTQYAKAQKFPQFGRVFSKMQDYIEGISTLANQAADNAPSILPKLEGWRDLAKTGLKPEDAKAVAAPIFEGTLSWTRVDGELVPIDEARADGFEGEAGVVFTKSELRDRFGLTDGQAASYYEFRAAVNDSLDQLVSSEVIRLLGDVPPGIKALAMSKDGRARLRQAIADSFENQEDPLLQQINDKFDHVDRMKARGYAPLSRFGKFWVHVVDQDGQTQYFGLAETRSEANRLARGLRDEFPQAAVEQGVMSQEFHKLMSAVPLDAMELFASAIGADQSEVFQKYIKLAKNNRSTMKRLMKRKGTSGFSEDVPRVLASFVTSNARAASTALNIKDAKDLASDIPQGDIKDEAIKMVEAVTEPEESGAAIRGVMFANFIGGSIASAVVNITQPFMMTLPYLSQWGGAIKAGARLVSAARMMAAGVDEASDIGKALKRAENEGIVSPQEIHHLIARASGGIGGRNLYLQKLALLWAGPFSVAEQFNRQVSFLAAYQTAQAEGMADPFGFAEKAVIETQGLYNAGNKPNASRGVMGATAMTFKQYSIHYLEWLARMAKSGPEGKKAAVLALALLVMAAGSDGLPFMDDLDDVFDTVGQAMGYDTNTKRARREMVASVLGEDMAEVATRGFSAAGGFPVDLSVRMGMGNLLPATDLLMKSNTDTARSLAEIAGPGGAMFTQYRDAARALLNGDIGGAVQKASPVALQNLAKAAKMAETGEYRDQRDRKVTDVDETDVGMKALSFQPARIARESTRMSEARQSEMLAKTVEGEITDKWARAIADGDKEAEKEALKMRDDWNEKNPDQPIVVKRSQAVRKARNMKMDRRDRFIKGVAPERRALVDKEIS